MATRDGIAGMLLLMAMDTCLIRLSDGYHVNRDGAWVEPDGSVHTMQSK